MSKLYYPPPSWKPKPSKKSAGHSAVMATTRAATFSAKIRTLSDFHSRIMGQQQPPSSAEIVTTLRYFQQTLVGFLKELPAERSALFEAFSAENTPVRTGLYPNLNYSGLFYGIMNLLDAFPMLSSAHIDISEAILDTLKALYFFIDRDCIDQMPLLLAGQLGVFPAEMDRRLVHLLCDCVLPYSFGEGANGRVSVPAVLILILHHPSDPCLHSMAVESLMRTLSDLYNDLMTVIASGTSESRIVAANLLFHYWPLMNPAILNRKSVQYKIHAWSPLPCQNINCVEHGLSTRLTFEPALCANLGDTSPPLFLCQICADSCQVELPMRFMCQPLPVLISATCQMKGCQSSSRMAVSTCFDEDCIRSHGHVPLRLCYECSAHLHATTVRSHACHSGPGTVWSSPLEYTMVEAVVKLLRETSAQLVNSSDGEAAKRPKWLRQLESGRELGREVDPLSDERRMLSRFGIWLMVAHCPPVPEATQDCIRSHGHVPLRLCYECSAHLHATTVRSHACHSGPGTVWSSPLEYTMVEAVVKLLRETSAQLVNSSDGEAAKRPKWLRQLESGRELGREVDPLSDERRMLSRFGIWLMVAHCPPVPEATQSSIGYLLSVLFQWFATTALLPNDAMGQSLEQLKADFACEWLNQTLAAHYEEFVAQLLPQQLEPGGSTAEDAIWDVRSIRREQFREGLGKLLALAPYDVVSLNTWSLVMPSWLHALNTELLDEEELLELKVPLSKLFEPDLCPLPFEAHRLFEFIVCRLNNNAYDEVLKAIDWLHSEEMDGEGEAEDRQRERDSASPPPTGPLAVQLIMTDILAQQIRLAGGPSVLNEKNMERLFSVIAQLFRYHPEAVFEEQGWRHNCKDPDSDQFVDCLRCQQALFLYQVLHQVLEQFCPREESRLDFFTLGDEAAREFADWLSETSGSVHQQVASASSRRSPSPRALSSSSPAGTKFFASPSLQRHHQPQSAGKAMQEVSTPAELAGALPAEEVESSRTQAAMTIAEQSPLGMACVSATIVEDGGMRRPSSVADVAGRDAGVDEEEIVPKGKTRGTEPPPPTARDRLFWDTSVGRFRFSLCQMPAQLQLIFDLLMNVEREPDPDENLLISRLWTLLRSDFSHVGQMAVPLLLHAITLPLGEDVFWEMVNKEFTAAEWQCRLKAVDRVLVLAQFVPAGPVRSNRTLQTTLSCAFSHLIISVYDPNPVVAQKAILSLESLPRQSLLLICQCLEAQFDSCILDRPLIISRLHLLGSLLPDESLYSWDFFIQRFETLALEAQLKAQQSAGTDSGGQYVQDLLHSDPMSELYQRKVTRARQSLNEADSVRSIVRSLRESSLRHQLNAPGAKGDQEQREQAQQLRRMRHRRGAIAGKQHGGVTPSLTWQKLRKVLVVVRVVSAWRDMAGRLLLPPSRRSSRMSVKSATSGGGSDIVTGGDEQQHSEGFAGDAATDPTGAHLQQPLQFQRRCSLAVPPLLLPTLPQMAALNSSASIFSLALADLTHQNPLHAILSPAASSMHSSTNEGRYGRIREFTDEESNLCLLLNRVVDMQNSERHTVFLVVSLFVHFLAGKRCGPADNAKKQSVLLRHFNTLLGYSNSDKCFTIPPARLRRGAVCNAFLYGLPEVLDSNLLIGNQLLSIVLQLLLYLPSPQKFASDAPSADYSLRLLSSQQQHCWLHSLITILYKYRCDAAPVAECVRKLMLVVVQTMEHQCHQCPVPGDKQQHQQRIIPPDKQRRSAAIPSLLEPGGWSSSAYREIALSIKKAGKTLADFPSMEQINVDEDIEQAFNAAEELDQGLRCVTRFIDSPLFPWQETNVFVPGNSCSAAKQLIRVILHQLSSSGIALQLFNMPIPANELNQFWNRIANALTDFAELNPVAFAHILLEDLNEAWPVRATRILHNLAIYTQFVPSEGLANWVAVVGQLEGLFRRMQTQLTMDSLGQISNSNGQPQQNMRSEVSASVLVMSRVMRVQNFASIKGAVQLVESFAKWLVEMLHRCPVELRDLLLVCSACNRGMIRERDKQILTRAVVGELVAALKFKCELVEPNHLSIVRLVLQDFGEPLGDDWAATQCGGQAPEGTEANGLSEDVRGRRGTMAGEPLGTGGDQFNSGAAEAIRPHVPELLEFIADMHVLAKLKKQTLSSSDRVGGDLKAGLAELIALEMSRPSVRDSRTVMRFIPWLYSPPSLAQALPGAFAESVANVRVLSWILLGALHARGGVVAGGLAGSTNQCLPVPQSVVHMSALFHAFHLCQLWTIYCEQTAATCRSEETLQRTMQQILDFWARVTPAILQLLCHSKVLADMVNLHFVNTLQALQQVNSAVLCQLYPMWEPVLTAHHAHIPRQLRLKLDAVEAQLPLETPQMRPWLSKVRYKISQIELQTSAASPFYNV
uniref:Protein unc-79 homolog n=1 Tax=Globodera pallida TaxID=36090 RepID=A0A183BT47_GLOPA